MSRIIQLDHKISCFHCGNPIPRGEKFSQEDKLFCCNGCKSIFEIINNNGLCEYYNLKNAGPLPYKNTSTKTNYDFLDQTEYQDKLHLFRNSTIAQVQFFLPQVHCTSCTFLLDQLNRIEPNILSSRLQFESKTLFVSYKHQNISLNKIAQLLDSIGYPPSIDGEIDIKIQGTIIRRQWMKKTAVAGFAFGNVMLIQFADYLAIQNAITPKINLFFQLYSILLAIPVLLYSALDIFKSAWKSIRTYHPNIDVPIVIALVITFSRSIYEILLNVGSGYLDSFTGIVFFLLIGRWLQSSTSQILKFDRSYTSFFPLAVQVFDGIKYTSKSLNSICKNDLILIKNNEIIPTDGRLSKGQAELDYHFVTGESKIVYSKIGDEVFAGGRQKGGNIEVVVTRPVSSSYLTHLWNNPIFTKEKEDVTDLYDVWGIRFTYLVLILGISAGFYWYSHQEYNKMWNAVTTVLIVACPCALLLSKNFTHASAMVLLSKVKCFLKNSQVVNRIADTKMIFFDKTGTLLVPLSKDIKFHGSPLTNQETDWIASLLQHSTHPLALNILKKLHLTPCSIVDNYNELPNKGIEGWVDDHYIKIGNASFLELDNESHNSSSVYVRIDRNVKGYFQIPTQWKPNLIKLLLRLRRKFQIGMLTGDHLIDENEFKDVFGKNAVILKNLSPKEKMNVIENHQFELKKVMMVGDGLNDAGALQQSDVGIAVTENTNYFTPACDVILHSQILPLLDKIIEFSKKTKQIILGIFIYSIIYNVIGLYFSLQGILQPVIAAILMPASSISIILISLGFTRYYFHIYFKPTLK